MKRGTSAQSLRVDPDSLVACYGKPRRPLVSRGSCRPCDWVCSSPAASRAASPASTRPPTRECEVGSTLTPTHIGELGFSGSTSGSTLPIFSYASGSTRPLSATLGSQQTAGSIASSPALGSSIVVLGPRYWAAKVNDRTSDPPGQPSQSRTFNSKFGDAVGISLGDIRPRSAVGLSLGDIRHMVHTRPPHVREVVAPVVPEPHCGACFKGLGASFASPHGPEGYREKGRSRAGARPHSPDANSKAQIAIEGDYDTGDEPVMTSLRRRNTLKKEGSGSFGGSNDGNSSADVGDLDEWSTHGIIDQKRGEKGRGWAQKNEKKSKNPFVEFEDREQRLIQERQWLLEADGLYMLEKKKDLRHNKTQDRIDLEGQEQEKLYEGRTLYGPHSMKMQEKKGNKIEIKLAKPAANAHSKTASRVSSAGGSRGARGSGKKSKKGESADASIDTSILKIKMLKKELEFSGNAAERVVFEEEREKKKKEFKEAASRISLAASFGTLFSGNSAKQDEHCGCGHEEDRRRRAQTNAL